MKEECPYCGAAVDLHHEEAYDESETYEKTCGKCGKTFAYTLCISVHYNVFQADCLNGAEHNFVPAPSYPQIHPDRKQCKDCGLVENGEIDKEEYKRLFGQYPV